jgi:hypothetical protein
MSPSDVAIVAKNANRNPVAEAAVAVAAGMVAAVAATEAVAVAVVAAGMAIAARANRTKPCAQNAERRRPFRSNPVPAGRCIAVTVSEAAADSSRTRLL